MALTVRDLRRIEAWSDWQAAGGSRISVVDDAIAARASVTIQNEQLLVSLPIDSPAISALGARKVIRIDQSDSHVNSVLWSNDLSNAVWLGSAVPSAISGLDATHGGTLLTDTSNAAFHERHQSIAVPNDNRSYVVRWWVKKETAAPTSFPLFALNLVNGTTGVGRRISLNKQTGAWAFVNVVGPGGGNVYDKGNAWLVEVYVTNNSTGNTAITFTTYAAAKATLTGVDDATVTGSVGVLQVQFDINDRIVGFDTPIFTTTAPVTLDAVFDEYKIIERAVDDSQGMWSITAAPLRLTDLAGCGLISRKDSDGVVVYDFEVLGLTPIQVITNWVLPALAAAGYGWISVGNITPTAVMDMTFAWDTPLSVLIRTASATQSEIDLRRVGTGSYVIDIVPKINSSAQQADIRVDKNLVNITRTETSVDQATRVAPKGSVQDEAAGTMARATWLVAALVGTTVTLSDAAGGKGPLQYDSQLNGKYLRKIDGTLTLVSSSTAASQQVVVASATGITVGDLIQFRADSSGSDLTYLDNPAAISAYGIKLAIREVPDVPATNNLIKNPVMRVWPGALPNNWTAVNAPTTAKQVAAPFTALGGASIKVTATADGQGVVTDAVPIFPTATNPYVSGFAKVWVASGNARVELLFTTGAGTKVWPSAPAVASASVLGQWADLGESGFDANAAGATAVAVRVVQQGAAASVFYVDAAQATATGTQQPFFEGSGATRLWQEANAALADGSTPVASYVVPLADLEAYDPVTWSESALIIGANARIVDPRLSIDIVTRIVGIERDYINTENVSVTLSNRPEDLSDILAATSRPDRDIGASDDTLTNPQQPKISASFDVNGQLIINSFGDNDVVSQKIAWATGSAPSAATVRAASPILQQNISGLATGSIYSQGTTVFIAAFTYNARGFESAPLAVVSESRQGAIIDYTPFASTLAPIAILSALPGTGAFIGQIVFLTTDKKLYRWDGTSWSAAVAAVDITGQIGSAQIAANAVGSTQIAALAVTNAKIAANAVNTGQLAASAVTNNELAALAVTGAKIAANTITAANIAAHTITAAQITALTITSAEIATGAIIADKISAGAITAGKIAIGTGGAALNSDPNTSDIDAWEYLTGNVGSIATVTDGKVGNTTLRSNGYSAYVSHVQPYDPAKSYRVRGWVRRDGTSNGAIYLGMGVYNSSGGFSDSGGNYFYVAASGAIPTANTWTEYQGVLPINGFGTYTTTPVSMRIVALLDYNGGGAATGYYEAQDVRLEEVLPGTLIQDGAIITNKLAANAVTAAKIQAGTITANEIAAATITGANIAANTISASNLAANTITAGQIQAGAIGTTELAAGAITAAKIAAGAITANEISVGTITPLQVQGRNRCKLVATGSPTQASGTGGTRFTAWTESSGAAAWDIGGLHDDVTNPSRITIPSGGNTGTWIFIASMSFGFNATGDRSVAISKNGTTVATTTLRATSTSSNSTILQCFFMDNVPAVGDFYEVFIWQNSGVTLNTGGGTAESYFSAIHLW